MADASQVKLSFRDELAWGEAVDAESPSRPGREFRFTGETLDFNQESVPSEEIRDDRNVSGFTRVSAESAGDVNIEASFGSHDPLLEGAFFDNWETAVDLAGIASPEPTVTVTANVSSPIQDSTGTIAIPSASPDFFAPIRVGSFVELSGTGSPDVDGFYLVTAKPSPGNLTVQPSPAVSTSGKFRVRSSGIRNGVTFKSFLIEKEFSDITQFQSFTGMRVGTWTLTVAPGSLIAGSLSFQGKTVFAGGVTAFGGSPATEPIISATEILNAVDNISDILIDGLTPTGVDFTEITFAIDNQLRPQPAIGSLENVGVGAGQIGMTGTLASYFSNRDLYDKFRSFATVRLSFVATDLTGNSYLFFFPSFKLGTGSTPTPGNNQDVFATFEFQAFRDATLGFAFGLNRFAEDASILLPATADQ